MLNTRPWLTEEAINFLEHYLADNKNAKILEFGCGGSTIWFSKRTTHLISIEHNNQWFEKVKNYLEFCKEGNKVDLRLIEENYYKVCEEFPDNFFDLILVDGVQRMKCINSSIRILKNGGILMLDNAERRSYKKAYELLKEWQLHKTFQTKIDSKDLWETNWWIKSDTNKQKGKIMKLFSLILITLFYGNLCNAMLRNTLRNVVRVGGLINRYSSNLPVKRNADATKPLSWKDYIGDAAKKEKVRSSYTGQSLDPIFDIISIIDERDEQGNNGIHHAVLSGDIRSLQFLCGEYLEEFHPVPYCKNPYIWDNYIKSAIDATNNEGRTPLHIAAIGGNIDAVQVLLAAGVKTSKKDKYGKKAIDYAYENGNIEIVNLITEYNSSCTIL